MISSNSTTTDSPVSTSTPEQIIAPPFYAQCVHSRSTGRATKPMNILGKKAVEMTGGGCLSHDTTGRRIGWRATLPAVDLGGGGRGWVARESSVGPHGITQIPG